jgi:hypothetical protein
MSLTAQDQPKEREKTEILRERHEKRLLVLNPTRNQPELRELLGLTLDAEDSCFVPQHQLIPRIALGDSTKAH